MNRERNCQKCIHHISGLCCKWDCEMQTLEDYRDKVIDEFAEMLKENYEEHNFDLCLRQNDYYSYSNSCMLFESYIDKIAEQLKAGDNNE